MNKEVSCSFCNHKQISRSKLDRITCSNCGKKFFITNRNALPMTATTSFTRHIISKPEEENIKKESVKLD